MPQASVPKSFYVPVNTPEDGKRMLDTLAAYDAFQLQNNIKDDYANTGGLQYFDDGEQEWNDWFLETNDDWFDNVDQYCESDIYNEKYILQHF